MEDKGLALNTPGSDMYSYLNCRPWPMHDGRTPEEGEVLSKVFVGGVQPKP